MNKLNYKDKAYIATIRHELDDLNEGLSNMDIHSENIESYNKLVVLRNEKERWYKQLLKEQAEREKK